MLSNPTLGAELGVRKGKFSAYLLNQFPSLTMIGVDLCEVRAPLDREGFETYEQWDWPFILKELKNKTGKYGDRFRLIKQDTVSAADQFDDHTFDFVFIDAEHTYEGVKADIAAWRNKVKPGGLLCGHDFHAVKFPGVVKAVREAVGEPKMSDDAVWSVCV